MKKLLATLLAMAMMVSLLAGCGPAASAPAETEAPKAEAPAAEAPAAEAPAEEIVLEFQQWFDNEMPAGYLQGVCDAFTAETGVKIKLLSNPYADTKTQLEASAVAGTMADIVALDGGWIYDYATQGHLADLDALYAEIGMDTSKLSLMTAVNGTTVAQPLVNFPSMIAVNRDLLKAAGVEELPETWTEFMEACKAVTDPANNVYGFGMNMSTDNPTCMEFFTSFAWNSGGTVLTAEGKPYMAGNDIMIKTAEFFKSLFDEQVVVPGMYTMTDADKVQEFVNGRIAFMADSVAHLTNIREQAPDMDLTFMLMPHTDDYDGPNFMRVNNWAVGIASSCEHPKEAAMFIEYLLRDEVNADLCVTAGGFAVNTAANPEYTDTSDAFVSIKEAYASGSGKSEYYSMPTAEALMRVLDEELVMYLDGDYATAEEMLELSLIHI